MYKVVLLLFPLLLLAQDIRPVDQLDDTLVSAEVVQYSPALTTSLSLVPGVGQFATKNWLKGSIHLGLNAVFWSQAIYNYQSLDDFYSDVTYADTLATLDGTRDSLTLLFEEIQGDTTLDSSVQYDSLLVVGSELVGTHHTYGQIVIDQEWEKRATQNWFIWAGSVYLWNLMDAYGVSNTFKGNSAPSPKRAALLSAIPFTGAGQWYNGDPFKAGLVTATEIGFFVSAINFSLLRHDIEKEGLKVSDAAGDLMTGGDTLFVSSGQREVWRDDYKSAGSIRTQFIWYGVIFYIYGIVDAYVDASLHGFNRKFDITAGYTPGKEEYAFALTMKF